MEDDKHRDISGPYNIMRLEGEVDGVKKILYLFFDIHISRYQCEDIDSVDITSYLLKVFRKAKTSMPNTTYDFFLETYTRPSDSVYDKYQSNYINKVRRLFNQLNRKSRIMTKEMNVRLHYTDHRDFSKLQSVIEGHKLVASGLNYMWEGMRLMHDNLKVTLSGMNQILRYITLTENLIKGDLTKKRLNKDRYFQELGKVDPPLSEQDELDMLSNIFHKMKKSYKHDDVRSGLIDQLNGVLKICKRATEIHTELASMLNEKISTLSKDDYILQKYDPSAIDFLSKMKKDTIEMMDICVHASIICVDIFMMRRFLDKDYITNALYYCGGSHASYVATVLVKHFGFKITHIDKAEDSLEKIHKDLKKVNEFDYYDVSRYFRTYYQCSGMEGFPDLLT